MRFPTYCQSGRGGGGAFSQMSWSFKVSKTLSLAPTTAICSSFQIIICCPSTIFLLLPRLYCVLYCTLCSQQRHLRINCKPSLCPPLPAPPHQICNFAIIPSLSPSSPLGGSSPPLQPPPNLPPLSKPALILLSSSSKDPKHAYYLASLEPTPARW